MDSNLINKPSDYFDKYGGLHDACVKSFSWNNEKNTLSLEIDDLNSNFLGLPDYQGIKPVVFVFSSVTDFDCDIQISDDIFRIFDVSVENKEQSYLMNIKYSPGGYMKFYCCTIKIVNL